MYKASLIYSKWGEKIDFKPFTCHCCIGGREIKKKKKESLVIISAVMSCYSE